MDEGGTPPQPGFEKVLWRRQQYPDNYNDASFLEHLQQNLHAPRYAFRELVFAALPLSTRLSACVIFTAVFVYLHRDLIRAQEMIWVSSVVGVLGYLVWEEGKPSRRSLRWTTLRSATMLLFLLLLLSGVLRTLTLSTTEDSIWSLSVTLLLVHLILSDHAEGHSIDTEVDVSFPSALSLNAATSASVVLASRLDSNASVFALVLFAIEWFALFPIMRREVVRRHPGSALRPVVLTTSLSALALLVVLPLSAHSAIVYVLAVPLGATFGVPALWMYIQRYRNELKGPWDCAVPRL